MSENAQKSNLYEWLREYRDFDLTAWERLPDLELYMDQLINYIGRMLKLQEKSESAPLLTASMVNNYVKAGYVARPQHKKYNKEHIASLYMLCSVKQNLSVPDASLLLTMLSEYCTPAELYTLFGERRREIAEELTQGILESEETDSKVLLNMALDLTLRASAERMLAERLLAHLADERGLILAHDDDAERAVEKAVEEAVMKAAEKTAAEKKKAAEREVAEKKAAEKAEKEKAEREAAERKRAEKAEREAAERAEKERAEREAAEKKKAKKDEA